MVSLSARQVFEQWRDNQRRSYQYAGAKLEAFNQGLAYLVDGNGPTSDVVFNQDGFGVTREGIYYRITYGSPQSLTVNGPDGRSESGFVRQLIEIRDRLTQPNNSDPLFCNSCRKLHKKYGMEIELNIFRSEEIRRIVLMKLNARTRINPSHDDYGIDGSQEPIELRNINANTSSDLVSELTERLGKLKEAQTFAREHFPFVRDSAPTTHKCGIHVHEYHKGILREKLVTAHSLIGLLINHKDNDNWKTRLDHSDYGQPYTSRSYSGSEWCRSSNPYTATELRMFNVIHPNVLKWAIDKTDELAPTSGTTQNEYQRYMRDNNLVGSRLSEPQTYEKTVRFFVERGIVTEANLNGLVRDLNAVWMPFNLESFAIPTQRRRGARVEPPPTPTPSTMPTIPSNDETAHRVLNPTPSRHSIWCNRIMNASTNLYQWITVDAHYFRNSLRRHFLGCVQCATLKANLERNGYTLRCRPRTSQFGFMRIPVRR